MKKLLFLILITFTLCEEEILGKWIKHSIYENSLDIDRSFHEANEDYIKSNNVEEDDLIRLTVYSQLVSGTNYKITFVDSKSGFPTVHEYIINKPLRNGNKNEKDFIIEKHNEYQADNGLVPFNDPLFEKLENNLYKHLKDSEESLKFISFVYPIENTETKFFMINAYTADGQHQYILCQDKVNEEFYSISKIK